MLTKGELERCWKTRPMREREVFDQAVAAIDLAAENAQLKAELAEYAEAFSEQNNALSDNIIANARLKAKLDDAGCEIDRCHDKINAVTAECNKSRQTGKRLSALAVLDIINKVG